MKTLKRSLIVLSLIYISMFIGACCECIDPVVHYYEFDSISTMHIDNSFSVPIFTNSGEIPKEAYGIRVDFTLQKVAQNNHKSFSMISSAYATSCECPPDFEYIAKNAIQSLKIYTLQDFNDQFAKNSEVTDLFKVYTYNQYKTINDHLSEGGEIYYFMPYQDKIELYLMTAPSRVGEHQFKVDIEFADESILSSTTTPINLN